MNRPAAGLRTRLAATAVIALAVATLLAVTVTRDSGGGGGGLAGSRVSDARLPAAVPLDPAAHFIDSFVDGDGRVVRRDQGSDTVSEGQSYAMLLAVASHNQRAFDRIWSWTSTHLLRTDGLLSWTWAKGRVTDPNSASDADVDAAHALVAAGRVFARPDLTRAGVELGRAVLDHETATTPLGRVLVAGQWATSSPAQVNPSYSAPVAYRALSEASGDPRWAQVAEGDARVLNALLAKSPLPPDWAQVRGDGSVDAMQPPTGGPVTFGLDAQRIAVRYAAGCEPDQRRLAARLAPRLPATPSGVRGVYDLGGAPQVDWQQPLAMVASAAAQQAEGDRAAATTLLDAAAVLDARGSTYYGAAWAALGSVLLRDPTAVSTPCPNRSQT